MGKFSSFSNTDSSVLSFPRLEVRTCGMYSHLKVEGLHEGQDMLFSPSSQLEVMNTATTIIFIILLQLMTIIVLSNISIIKITKINIILSIMIVVYVPPRSLEEVISSVQANLIPAMHCPGSTALRALFYSWGLSTPPTHPLRPLFV